MGASESVIVNQNDSGLNYDAGGIDVEGECKLVKCAPKIEKFNNDKEILVLVIIILLFISLLFIKRK
jgi:hypothetical protein